VTGQKNSDVFLSYRCQEPVKTWVRKILEPALSADGLRVLIDYRDFGLSEYIVGEMARAVVECRYTLAVLTPAYLKSGFTELEEMMAEHLGLENRERRLMLIIREPCELPIHLRVRLALDMTSDNEFETNLARLTAALRRRET
jgi:hypothetical protein